MRHILTVVILFVVCSVATSRTLEVGEGREFSRLQAAAAQAEPGDTILIYDGTYSGGDYIENLQGTESAWITIKAAGGNALFYGGSQAFHLTDPAYLRIEGLRFNMQTGNGVNIDDGGTYESPAHHIVINLCEWMGMDAAGNNDELKMSGVDDFVISNCFFSIGAAGGSLVDMVGCHRGVFENNYFTDGGSNSIQAKGATKDILITRNVFTFGGQRAINIGGSTGLAFFRPLGTLYEASEIKVHSNIFEGSVAPIAFVGAVNCEVINNTIIRPERWAIRILQETTEPGFLPCGNNTFRNNIVIHNSAQPAINIGGGTAPETFTFSNNLWFNPDNASWSGPNTPVNEPDRLVNVDPLLTDTLTSLASNSPAVGKGFSVASPTNDFNGKLFASPRSIGAVEGAVSTSVLAHKALSSPKVYPNPTTNELTVMTVSDNETDMKIVDLLGKVIWQGKVSKEAKIDVRSWQSGVYVVHIGNSSQLVIKS
ncbi:MAG TPA: right-handed parallel beta-helix repeat-containing protein [Candidatus Kapabacteria bacterium]